MSEISRVDLRVLIFVMESVFPVRIQPLPTAVVGVWTGKPYDKTFGKINVIQASGYADELAT